MKNQTLFTVPAAGLLLAAVALTGCSPREDAGVANTGNDPAVVARNNPPAAGTPPPQSDASVAMGNAADATRSAVDAAGDKVADASITTMVNAELAKDAQLSALQIDVDTVDGKVALKGEAPTATAKERATTLAQGVKGVKSVENQLRVVPPKS